MELVLIAGGQPHLSDQLANRMRAHGYRYINPKMYFIDDFGDIKFDDSKMPIAEEWCFQRALKEVSQHHDVVLNGNLAKDGFLLSKARQEGYRIQLLKLDDEASDCEKRIDELISIHEDAHPTVFRKIGQRLFGQQH